MTAATAPDRIVLIGERFWRERLQRSPDAVGRQITLDGQRFTIVGILPATFRYPNETHEVWLPLDIEQPPASARGTQGAEPKVEGRTARPAGPSLEPLVRLQPGLDRTQAHERIIARGIELNAKAGDGGKNSAGLMPIGQVWDDKTERSLMVLGGAVVFLLLIVCANVANLTLVPVSRSHARSRGPLRAGCVARRSGA